MRKTGFSPYRFRTPLICLGAAASLTVAGAAAEDFATATTASAKSSAALARYEAEDVMQPALILTQESLSAPIITRDGDWSDSGWSGDDAEPAPAISFVVVNDGAAPKADKRPKKEPKLSPLGAPLEQGPEIVAHDVEALPFRRDAKNGETTAAQLIGAKWRAADQLVEASFFRAHHAEH